MPLIPEELVDEIQSRADIAEVIGRYVPLKRAGRYFKALCPFHKEKTASFSVNPEKQIFHCFGCGVGGNVFSFLMRHDRLTFPEAVRQLADQLGIRVPDRQSSSSDAASIRQLALLTEKACQYFERQFADTKSGAAARAYVKSRGVSERIARAFRLGYAPSGWDNLLKSARASGASETELEAAGLAIKGRSGYYDRFRNRLLFAIRDARARVVAFGGRSLDGQEPKYLNSPETALYSKGRHLFGLADAKDAIARRKTALVVEGYFDCVVLAEAGISHVVSPLGTALTLEQAKLLKRYAENVILAFDADVAGEEATLRGIDLLVEIGLQVSVAQLPGGLDPDECLRQLGRERFEILLGKSLPVFEFLADLARRRFSASSAEERVRAAQFILPTIAKVQNVMLRREYVRQLAGRFELDEAAVAQELEKIQPRQREAAAIATSLRPVGALAQGPERLLAALVLDDPSRWDKAQGRVSLDDFADEGLRQILCLRAKLSGSGQVAPAAQLISRLRSSQQAAMVTELIELAQSIGSKEEAFEDCLRRMHANILQRQRCALREQLKSAHDSGNEAEARRLLQTYQQQLKGD